MRCLVTGAAGFIGSHLSERLLALGHEVVGLDSFVPYYARSFKDNNLAALLKHPHFTFHPLDLRRDDLTAAVTGAELVIHLAAMPGLAASWVDFDGYLGCNVVATQRLIEAVRQHAPGVKRFVYGSTSSVYGRFASGDESLPTKPISPYGVTKLAGEQLARAYFDSFGLPLVVLRFFSVYGPRQRPDMAYHIFMRALIEGKPITLFGDGQQVRGNTFVADCAEAVIAAGTQAQAGETYNVGGGEMVSLIDIVRQLEAISGKTFTIDYKPARPGDQRHTFADTSKLQRQLGWKPHVTLQDGLLRQYDWLRAMMGGA